MKFAKHIIALLFAAALLAGSVTFIVLPKKEFSENENRNLAEFPEISFDAIESGDFTSELEVYLRDHFPLRDSFMKLKTSFQFALGYKKIDSVHIGKERLFQDVALPDASGLIKSSNSLISSLENKDIKTSVILLPTASEIYKDELPSYTKCFDENKVINDILSEIECDISINPTDMLKQKSRDTNIFYHSDHHWTTTAAFYVYELFSAKAENDFSPIEEYEKEVISNEFFGSLYSTVPDDSKIDEVHTLSHPDISFKAYYTKSIMTEPSEYEYFASEFLDKKDKYCYFGGGNFPLVILENEKATADCEIAVIKDSYANAFVPFLAENYSKIYVIDPRYFVGNMTVSEYINSHEKISDVLILYGLNSINDGVTYFS